MADVREAILARVLAVAKAVEGIAAAARNAVDVPGLSRPAILLHDAAETLLDKPPNERQSRAQRMEMSPPVIILASAATPDVGSLLNTYRARFLSALFQDAVLWALLSGNGEIRYEGCSLEPASAEAKEGRMELNIVFTYAFRVSDL